MLKTMKHIAMLDVGEYPREAANGVVGDNGRCSS